jgi:tetratricopeptide (TPR) repeat protein
MTSTIDPPRSTNDNPTPDATRTRPRTRVLLGAALGLALVAAGALGVAQVRDDDQDTNTNDPGAATASATAEIANTQTAGLVARVGGGSLAETIGQLQDRVASVPGDSVAWATLGIALVQQAHAVGDPSLYSEAQGALDESLQIDDEGNFLAYTGLAAVAAGRHDFVTAEQFALDGLAINAQSATLHGVLSDAQIQLGRYDEGFASVQRMVDLSPDTASLARVSYTHELSGDVDEARAVMERALEAAGNPSDQGFALFQLGELSLSQGDPTTALGLFNRALAASPDNVSALSGKAHALGVSGQTLTSIDAYRQLVERAPLPDYLIEFGSFLEAHGRPEEAEVLYDEARSQLAVDERNGVRADAGIIFFEADHGDPAEAVRMAEEGIAERPFFEMYEAYAWALYADGRYEEAAVAIDRAKEIGIRDAAMYVRAGLIDHALGNDAEAIRELQTALDIDPHVDPHANELLAELVAGT